MCFVLPLVGVSPSEHPLCHSTIHKYNMRDSVSSAMKNGKESFLSSFIPCKIQRSLSLRFSDVRVTVSVLFLNRVFIHMFFTWLIYLMFLSMKLSTCWTPRFTIKLQILLSHNLINHLMNWHSFYFICLTAVMLH